MSRLRKEPLSSIEFFWELGEKFLFCKRVLNSCQTVEQVDNCSRWFEKVLMNMENKMDAIRAGYSVYFSSSMYQKFKDTIHDMLSEWVDLANNLRNELSPPPKDRFPKCQQPYRGNGIGFHTV